MNKNNEPQFNDEEELENTDSEVPTNREILGMMFDEDEPDSMEGFDWTLGD